MIFELEKFGVNEKNLSAKDKKQIANFLKYNNHVSLKCKELVYSAELYS